MGMLNGFHDIAVAEIDLDAADPVQLAGVGATATTPMEVGSVTKAMTGLVIADAVSRGEVRMDVPVSTYLPQLTGSPAGTVTLHELVTPHLRLRQLRSRHPAPRLLECPARQELPGHRH